MVGLHAKNSQIVASFPYMLLPGRFLMNPKALELAMGVIKEEAIKKMVKDKLIEIKEGILGE